MPAFSIGYVYMPAALGVAITSIAFAPMGAHWAHRVSALTLKRLFAVFLLAVAVLLTVKT